MIEIWADDLREMDGKMITRKKEVQVICQLNVYVDKEINQSVWYTEKDVHNRIDSNVAKGKQFYMTYVHEYIDGKEARRS